MIFYTLIIELFNGTWYGSNQDILYHAVFKIWCISFVVQADPLAELLEKLRDFNKKHGKKAFKRTRIAEIAIISYFHSVKHSLV